MFEQDYHPNELDFRIFFFYTFQLILFWRILPFDKLTKKS